MTMERRMWEDRILMDREGLTSSHDLLDSFVKNVQATIENQSHTNDKVVLESFQIYKDKDENVKYQNEINDEHSKDETEVRETCTESHSSIVNVTEVRKVTKKTVCETKVTSKEVIQEGEHRPETCAAASSLQFCQSCRTGPQCCADLSAPDLSNAYSTDTESTISAISTTKDEYTSNTDSTKNILSTNNTESTNTLPAIKNMCTSNAVFSTNAASSINIDSIKNNDFTTNNSSTNIVSATMDEVTNNVVFSTSAASSTNTIYFNNSVSTTNTVLTTKDDYITNTSGAVSSTNDGSAPSTTNVLSTTEAACTTRATPASKAEYTPDISNITSKYTINTSSNTSNLISSNALSTLGCSTTINALSNIKSSTTTVASSATSTDSTNDTTNLHLLATPSQSRCTSTHSSDDSDSDMESVISFYLGKKDDEHCSVVEYEFYVDDDDNNSKENEEDYDSVCNSNEDELEERLVDIVDCDDEYDNQSDEENEYIIEYEDDIESSSPQIESGRRRLSYYQEPLEVILEILGEEGEEEGKTPHIDNTYRPEAVGDLMTFSHSEEVLSSSHHKQLAENIIIHEDSFASSQISLSNSFHANNEVQRNNEPCTSESNTATIVQAAESSQSGVKGEGSDAVKLKCLTTEIESYLRETTRLLESVSSYTKVPQYTGKDTLPLDASSNVTKQEVRTLQEIENEVSNVSSNNNCQRLQHKPHASEREMSSMEFEYTEASYEQNISEVEDLCVNIQEQLDSMTTKTQENKTHTNVHCHQENEMGLTNLLADAVNCQTFSDNFENVSQLLKRDAQVADSKSNMGINNESSHSCKSNTGSSSVNDTQTNMHHQEKAYDGQAETRYNEEKEVSMSCKESIDIFQTLKETKTTIDSRYYSAIEASTDAVDALEWEEHNQPKMCQKPSRIIYQPPERSQEDEQFFTSLENTQDYWLTAFEELESSLNASVDSRSFSITEDTSNQVESSGKLATTSTDSPDNVNNEHHGTLDPPPLFADSPNYVNTETNRKSSNCDSPPPTVSCLDNLEKLYKRLSQEYDLSILNISSAENQVVDGNSTHLKEKREESKSDNISMKQSELCAGSNKNNGQTQAHTAGNEQSLKDSTILVSGTKKVNIISNDKISKVNQEHDITVYPGSSNGKENAYVTFTKENVVDCFSQGDTKKHIQKTEICHKLENIFSKVDNNTSSTQYAHEPGKYTNSSTMSKYVKGETSYSYRDSFITDHEDLIEATNLQMKLNEILDGLDVMYENYMENKRTSIHACSPHTNRDLPDVMHESDATREASQSEARESKLRTKSTSEKSSFKDIIDISEDLKNICVFHVNKPIETTRIVKSTPDLTKLPFKDTFKAATGLVEWTESYSADKNPRSEEPAIGTKQRNAFENPGIIWSGSDSDEMGMKVTDMSTFLTTIRKENSRCYSVPVRYLERLILFISSPVQTPADTDNSSSSKSTSTHPKNMSALQLAAEGRDYLMWCPDLEFDNAVSALDIRGLVELVQTLQDAMAVEQQTFDSLSQQLEVVNDPLLQQRLSAALCTSQTRLARLCARNMRCFRQQALKVRQREGATSSESRSSSPRDSGLAASSAGPSDTEGDPRSPGVPGGPTFRNSLAFFQRAAHLVANNAKNTSLGARVKETRRRSSRGSSCYGSSSSEAWSVASDDPNTDFYPSNMGGHPDVGGVGGYEDDLLNMEEDPGTYEQVLFINGRPQYQDDVGWSGKLGRSNSWTPVSVDGSSSSSGGTAGPDGHHHHHQPYSVPHSHPSLPGRSAAPSHTDQASVADTNPEEGGSNVTLPRRKPYLNFKSVSSSSNTNSVSDYDRDNLSLFKDRIGITKNSALDTLTRTQSFKEGLNHCYTNENSNTSGLSRTQSFNDGLASDFNEFSSSRPKLQRAPSVDEILESVKYLRAKKTMVKSTPDLANVQEPVYSSASLPRHKSSKGKAPRAPGTSSLLGVKYNGHASNPHYERVPEPDYEHIPESSGGQAYYENICKGNNHYENIHLKGEVIYDSPRPTNSHHYDKVHNDLHYENLKYDAPVYENLDEKEPTYMNVKDKSGGKSNVYTKVESNKKSGSLKSIKSRSNKVTVSGNSMLQGATYDVPRAATHIYDSPQKQVRSVSAQQNNEYDTPKNNRSVLPQSTQIVLKSKHDQKKKIDDIFADCDQDSLEGDRDRDRNRDRNRDRDREPDIPSPDYGSEEEEDGFEDATNDYVTSEFPDEGLGESDTRSYYTEDPAGLEVILEEPEEEYCSSHASEDDLQREVDITYELKGERRSLDGSEGIGSAEGDTHSSGGSEHYGEEDCASSGIHSEDTPSPGPPVDSEKDPSRQKEQQKEDRTQKDRCVEVYPETVRQRQRNMMAAANKVDIKNWNSSGGSNNNDDTLSSPSKVKKFLPSVKALRNQFETGKTNGHSNNSTNSNTKPETNGNATTNGNGNVATNINGSQGQSRKSSSSSVASSSVCSTNSLHSPSASVENLVACQSQENLKHDPDEPVEPIFNQFRKVDEELKELMSKPPSTSGWNPRSLLKRLYYIPEAPRLQSQGTTYVNIEGYLEKLPSGRKKATFWNAWKRRYFVAKDGILYYYQGNQTEKPSMKMTLMGGRVESMEPNMVGVDDGSRDSKASVMLGIDDGKGHYVVVRCGSRQEAERWRRALETHTVEDFASQYVQPWPIPTNPALLRETLVIDIGSASIRAGVLASQATLPQVFMPSVVANSREGRRQVWGFDALTPEVRSVSSVAFPIRPSQKISKYSVDLSAVSSLLQKTFAELKVDPKNYHIQLSVPRVLNTNTQAELLRVLFDKHGVRSVNLTHQSILALYAYNATSGIVVDVGERMDIVPVIDGYIVDGGVSRVPYGGYRILDHLRQFLYMRNVSLINEVESYIIRHVLENVCYSANHYNTEKARCTTNSDAFEKTVSLGEYFSKDCPFESITLDFGRFQATEGLFNPDAWGLDHPGLHKLVHKAIMECSMDIRKEMSRSIFLAGGVTQMPGLADRLTTEIDNLTPPAIRPKVHASPYRYHAAYIGACVLAESPAFVQSRVTREDWNKYGNAALRKWSL